MGSRKSRATCCATCYRDAHNKRSEIVSRVSERERTRTYANLHQVQGPDFSLGRWPYTKYASLLAVPAVQLDARQTRWHDDTVVVLFDGFELAKGDDDGGLLVGFFSFRLVGLSITCERHSQ